MNNALSIILGVFEMPFIVSIILVLLSLLYLKRDLIIYKYKLAKFGKLFKLDSSLEKEMNNFRMQSTKLTFHFIKLFDKNQSYKVMRIPSQHKIFKINCQSITIDYIDNIYPYKYNVAEKFLLIDENEQKKDFLIVVNKYVENHYNIIIDKIEDKTYSLEIIFYSKISRCLQEIAKLIKLNIYTKENYISNMMRINIVNARKEDLVDIYTINMEEEEKIKIENSFFYNYNENLLLNIIFSKEGKIAFRKIFQNIEEKIILHFHEKEINLLKMLYINIIKKYLNADTGISINIENLKNEFNLFDKQHGYSLEINKKTNEEIIYSDLRLINAKFYNIPFYIRNYGKDDISFEDLKITEYLCYLNLLLSSDDNFLDRIQHLNEEKNKIFNKYSYLTNKDKILILLNLLENEKKDKPNYAFRSFYDLNEKCPYIQSELFFRKTISNLSYNSSLSFFYLQLNSGSGEDLLTKEKYYKIRMIPLIEIKYHLLKEFFYPYFFTYDSNDNKLALTNVDTQILSFNESNKIGYSKPKKLGEVSNENNMIKLAFLKFHEYAHIKFKGNYSFKLDPRYLLDDNLQLIYV